MSEPAPQPLSSMIGPSSHPRVVFFGSGPVAAESLRRLARHTNIEAVITKPRPAHHTGDVPVLSLAAELGLVVHTPADKTELSSLFASSPGFTSRLGVVIDYGIIINQDVIDYFPLGIVNSHFSLLPEWRGADPIAFSILSGQPETGVSLMLIVAALDEGDLLAQKTLAIDDTATTPSLTRQLIELSDTLLAATLPAYAAGRIKPYPQDLRRMVSYSRKLTKADGQLDLSKPAEVLEREIRAYQGWPKSSITLGNILAVVTVAHVVNSRDDWDTNTSIIRLVGGQLLLRTGQGYLAIDRLKPAGKAEMDARAFLAGYKQYVGL